MLELRIGLETESAALAAQRRTEGNLKEMRAALDDFAAALQAGRDAVAPDFRFHLEIARATHNVHFAELMAALGATMIPRARLDEPVALTDERREYLRRVNAEHENLFDAIAAWRLRRRAGGDAHPPGQQQGAAPAGPGAGRAQGFDSEDGTGLTGPRQVVR